MEDQAKEPKVCAACHKHTANPCGRVDCTNRKTVTVNVPDGSIPCYGGFYKARIAPQE